MKLPDPVVLVDIVELVVLEVLEVVAVTMLDGVSVLLPEGEGRSGEETDEADVDWAVDFSKASC